MTYEITYRWQNDAITTCIPENRGVVIDDIILHGFRGQSVSNGMLLGVSIEWSAGVPGACDGDEKWMGMKE